MKTRVVVSFFAKHILSTSTKQKKEEKKKKLHKSYLTTLFPLSLRQRKIYV